jgi:hypothetical protein
MHKPPGSPDLYKHADAARAQFEQKVSEIETMNIVSDSSEKQVKRAISTIDQALRAGYNALSFGFPRADDRETLKLSLLVYQTSERFNSAIVSLIGQNVFNGQTEYVEERVARLRQPHDLLRQRLTELNLITDESVSSDSAA